VVFTGSLFLVKVSEVLLEVEVESDDDEDRKALSDASGRAATPGA
jgi:hypothetical protein